LEQEKQRLEQLVKDRTKEVYHKNELLEEQSQKLKEMDRVKSRFFANISHEFRTPLTLILSPLEKMLSNTRDNRQKKELNVMRRNSQRLLTLINQLLDLTRFDSGKMTLQAAYQNIVPFLKGIPASFHTLARQNQLNLEFNPEEDEISLYFDAQKMEEVMYNLLINAVKFTPPGGKITISIAKEKPGPAKESQRPDDYIKISVKDTGIGISQEQIIHIFDRFYQAENTKDKNQTGTGIGLALTKEIVLLHHGIIDVHSRKGKGTEFEIRLPMGKKHLKSNEIVTASEIPPRSQKEKELETLYVTAEEQGDEHGEVEHDTAHEDKTPGQEKNVILVVEDHADVRKYIRDPLEPDYTVVEACDGKEGITKAKDLIPDLIVSDIMMPEADGFELTRVLKKDVRTSHIPIILLTAKASEKSIVRGLETGADDYITKPFSTKILLTRIKNLIDLRRQLQLRIQRQKMLLPDEISVSSVDDTFLKEFQDTIEKNLSDPELNIDMLCKKLYMGRSTLYRKVQALTGETPHQFFLSYRLERAAQLLKSNYGNVTEVAMETGFANPQYFSQCFKEKFHQSPSSFKTHGMGDL
jgi:signal transduction histidine kinase/DNA-binding response OmpR family regulator